MRVLWRGRLGGWGGAYDVQIRLGRAARMANNNHVADNESRVAVLVDCDNTNPEILEYALRVVAQFGRVVLRRGYGMSGIGIDDQLAVRQPPGQVVRIDRRDHMVVVTVALGTRTTDSDDFPTSHPRMGNEVGRRSCCRTQ